MRKFIILIMGLIMISQSVLNSIIYGMEKQFVSQQTSLSEPTKSIVSSLGSTQEVISSEIMPSSSTKMTTSTNSLSTTNEFGTSSKLQMETDLLQHNLQSEKDVSILDPNIVLMPTNTINRAVVGYTTPTHVNSGNIHMNIGEKFDLSKTIDSQGNQIIVSDNPILQRVTKELVTVTDSVSDSIITYNCNILVNEKCSYGLIGAGSYQFSSLNPENIKLFLYKDKFELQGVRAGSIYVNIKKNNITYYRIYLNILNHLNGSISNQNIIKGTRATFTVTSGNGNYTLTSSNANVATVSGSSKNWTVNGVGVGSATITLKDGKGLSSSIVVKVLPRELKLSTYSMNIVQGEYGYFNIIDGNGNYIVGKNNGNVNINSNGSSTAYKILGVGVGQTIVEIRDSQSLKAQLIVNVLPKVQQLLLDKYQVSLYIGQTITFRIISGNGGYVLNRNNINITYSQNGSDTYYNVTGNYVGSSTITIHDKQGQTVQLLANVIPREVELSLDRNNIELFNGNVNSFRIVAGNGNYNVTSSNSSIATISGSGNDWFVRGISHGSAVITVIDGKGKIAKLNVLVKDNPSVKISNIKYTPNVYNDGLGGVTFDIVGTSSQVGIDYYFNNGLGTNVFDSMNSTTDSMVVNPDLAYDKQRLSMSKNTSISSNIQVYSKILDLQKDNLYSIMVDLNCNSLVRCNFAFKPFVRDLAGNKYYGTNSWLSISKNGNNMSKIMSIDSLPVQDVIELKGEFSYGDSQGTLSSNGLLQDSFTYTNITDAFGINIYQIGEGISNFAKSNKGIYDGTIDALNDQIQDLKAVLDPQTYLELGKQLKLLALQFYDKGFEQFTYLVNNATELAEDLMYSLKEGFYALLSLSVYDKQYYSSYFGTVILISQITSKIPIPKSIFNKLLNKIHEARSKWLKIKLLNVSKLSYAFTTNFLDFVRKVEKLGGDYMKKLDDYILLLDSRFQGTDSYDFIQKLLNNSDAAIKDALDNQQVWIIFYKLQVWKEKLTKHVFEGDISLIRPYKLSGVHFKSALKEFEVGKVTHGDVVRFDGVKVGTNIYGEEYYNYSIKSYSQEKYIEEMNNHMIPWDRKGWVFKKLSTFFPDSRTVEKVKTEVELAFKNLTRCNIKINGVIGEQVYCGKMSDGVYVQFYENKNDLENLSTAFPNLNLELAQ